MDMTHTQVGSSCTRCCAEICHLMTKILPISSRRLRVWEYIYIYVYILYVCVCVCVCVCVYIYIYILCMYIYMYIYIIYHKNICVYIYGLRT